MADICFILSPDFTHTKKETISKTFLLNKNEAEVKRELEVGNIEAVIVCVLTVPVSYWVTKYFWKNYTIKHKISEKQKECQGSINKLEEYLAENGISQKKMDEILKLNFLELQDKLQKNVLTAEDVLKAYQAKALEVNKKLNCIVEPVWEAMPAAIDCDLRKKKIGPLHGVPVSVKENYYMQGYDSTGGMSLFLNKPAKEDGNLIKVLKHLGAIPFVRTNVPQSMMTFECSNPIYGTTVNPHNLKRGPGGSSGGEGAILGGEGSILGWGTDIGGSVRIPATFSGICSLKPTVGRLGSSSKTCEELVYGQTLIEATCGPMARDVDTVVEAMRAVLCQYYFELDPDIPPIPFREEIYNSKKPLRIGYYKYDGTTRCIPGVERGVDEAVAALEKMGHTMVPFNVPKVDYAFSEIIIRIFFGDGGQTFLDQMNEDLIDSSIQSIIMTYKLPMFLRRIVGYLVSLISRENLPSKIIRAMNGISKTKDWYKVATSLDEYRKEFLAVWKASKLDALVCPVMPYVAVPSGQVKYLLGGVSYSCLYNGLNYPAGVVPVTKVTAVDQKKMADYPAKKGSEKAIKNMFSADTGGLPVGVQCVGLPYQEELVLRVMKDLEKGLKKEPITSEVTEHPNMYVIYET